MRKILLAIISLFLSASACAETVAERIDDGIPASSSAATATKGNLWAANGTAWIPVVVGSNNKVLTADSSAASGVSWQTPGAGAGTVTSVATGNGLSGGTITGAGTIDLRLDVGGTLSKTLGAGSNEIGIAALGVATGNIAAAAVTYAKIQDVAARSVVGRAGATDGVTAAITASATGQVLRYNGTTINFGALELDDTDAVSGILPAGNGGTGSGFTAFTGPATTTKTFTLPNASATVLTDNTVVTVAQGGTGQSSYTNGQLLIGNTTGNTLAKTTLTDGAGITTTNGTGSITIASTLGTSVDLTAEVTGILPSANGGTANGFTKFTGPTTAERTFTLPDASSTITTGTGTSGRAMVWGAANTAADSNYIWAGAAAARTYTFPNASANILTDNAAVTVAQGGTGLASGTSGGIPYFSGGTTIASSAALAANQIVLGGGAATTPATLGSLGTTTTVLHGNAAGAPSFSAIVNGDITNGTIDLTTKVTGALPVANGGTAIASYAVGDILYASGATTLAKLAGVATGNALIAGGVTTAPSYGKIGLTTHVSGLLPLANLADGSALSVLGRSANSSGVMASIAAGSDGHFLRREGTSLVFKRAFDYIEAQGTKTANTSGGTPQVSGSTYYAREIDTTLVHDDTGAASVSSNQITIPAGTYYLEAEAAFREVDYIKLRWYQTSGTPAAVLENLKSDYAGNTNTVDNHWSKIEGRFTIAAQQTFEFQYRVLTNTGSAVTVGLGQAINFGTECFCRVRLWRLY